MAYRLEIMPAAERDLRVLPAAILARVDARIRELAEHPRPRGAEPIRGHRGGLRLRVGDYRILYTVDDAQQVVTIGRVRHRRDVYRGLDGDQRHHENIPHRGNTALPCSRADLDGRGGAGALASAIIHHADAPADDTRRSPLSVRSRG